MHEVTEQRPLYILFNSIYLKWWHIFTLFRTGFTVCCEVWTFGFSTCVPAFVYKVSGRVSLLSSRCWSWFRTFGTTLQPCWCPRATRWWSALTTRLCSAPQASPTTSMKPLLASEGWKQTWALWKSWLLTPSGENWFYFSHVIVFLCYFILQSKHESAKTKILLRF